jgi:predicted Zn-ribbon and HTH transcriptional regulator
MIDFKKLFHQKETETKKEEAKEEVVEKVREMQSTEPAEITIQAYKCLRCGHTWVPRKKEKPRVCPKCKSPYWDKPK